MNLRPHIIAILKKRYGLKCWYCGIPIRGSRIHIDHIKSKYHGGADNVENFALACQRCNYAKGKKSLREFFTWIRRIRTIHEFPATEAFDEDYSDGKLSTLCSPSINQAETQITKNDNFTTIATSTVKDEME